jgi:hypothetical protein
VIVGEQAGNGGEWLLRERRWERVLVSKDGGGGLVSGIIAVPKRYLRLALALDLELIFG